MLIILSLHPYLIHLVKERNLNPVTSISEKGRATIVNVSLKVKLQVIAIHSIQLASLLERNFALFFREFLKELLFRIPVNSRLKD